MNTSTAVAVFRNNFCPANMQALFFNLTFKFVVLTTQKGTLHLRNKIEHRSKINLNKIYQTFL
jgi:hypothetical protein